VKYSEKGKRVLIQLAVGAGVGIVICMVSALVVSLLIHTDTMSMNGIGYGAVIGLLLSSFACGMIAKRVEGFAPFAIVMGAELCLWGFLMILNMALFDFAPGGAAVTGGLLASGGTAAVLLFPGGNKSPSYSKRRKGKL
jgi:hypothetical protein